MSLVLVFYGPVSWLFPKAKSHRRICFDKQKSPTLGNKQLRQWTRGQGGQRRDYFLSPSSTPSWDCQLLLFSPSSFASRQKSVSTVWSQQKITILRPLFSSSKQLAQGSSHVNVQSAPPWEWFLILMQSVLDVPQDSSFLKSPWMVSMLPSKGHTLSSQSVEHFLCLCSWSCCN